MNSLFVRDDLQLAVAQDYGEAVAGLYVVKGGKAFLDLIHCQIVTHVLETIFLELFKRIAIHLPGSNLIA